MEVSKIKAVDLDSIRIKPQRSELRTRLEALEAGQGFEVSGVERGYITGAAKHLTKEGRSFSTKRLGPERYLVFRYA